MLVDRIMNPNRVARLGLVARLGVAAFALALVMTGSPVARAATFDDQTGRLTLDASSWSLTFDDISELSTDLGAWFGDADDGELSGPQVAELYVADASGLEGQGYLRMGGDVRTIRFNLDSLESRFGGRRVEIRFWQRSEGTRISASVEWIAVADPGEADSVVVGSFRFQPTGRITDDGWEEWTSGEVDFLAAGVVPLSHLELRDIQPTGHRSYETFREDLRVSVDGLEIMDVGPALVPDILCTPLDRAEVCGEHGYCAMGRCMDSAILYGPPPADAVIKDQYLDRQQFQFQSFEGARVAQSLMNVLAGAIEVARNTAAPIGFWGSLRRGVSALRDGHASAPSFGWGLGYSATNFGVCIHQGEADLLPVPEAAPMVFSVDSTNPVADLLQVGDVLVEVDGLTVAEWKEALDLRAGHGADPDAFDVTYAPSLITVAGLFGSHMTFARCERTGPAPAPCTTGEVELIDVDLTSLVGEPFWAGNISGWMADNQSCDYRFLRGVDDPSVKGYSFAGFADDGPIRTLIFNGLPDPYGTTGSAWIDTVTSALDPPPEYLILDQRLGSGGAVTTTDFLMGLLLAEGDFDRSEIVPMIERPLDDALWATLDGCHTQNTCGSYWAWVLHEMSGMESGLRGVSANVRMAVLNGRDVSGNDFTTKLAQYRTGATRIFAPGVTHGAFGPIVSLPRHFSEVFGGSMQLWDSIFVETPGDPRQVFATGRGVPPDETVLQRQSDALLGIDTTIEAAKAWLLQE
jgi:hypothetical protein